MALVVITMAVGVGVWFLKPGPSLASAGAAVVRLAVVPESPLPAEGEGVIALSPDGRHVAYVVGAAGRQRLYLRDVDQFEGKPIPGTEGADYPAFSPDGKWLAFSAAFKLMKVAVAGGMPVTVCEYTEGRGLSWESNDSILFNPGRAQRHLASLGGGRQADGSDHARRWRDRTWLPLDSARWTGAPVHRAVRRRERRHADRGAASPDW